MSRVQAIDTSVNALKAMLWQHDNAARLKTLMHLKQQWYENTCTQFWDNWVRDVFNIETANEFGLSVWGRILDIPLSVTSPGDVGKKAFGFGANNSNFGNGNFANLNSNQVNLTIDQRRMVIQLRYFQLTARGTVPETNEFLSKVFSGQGRVFVVDEYNMLYATYFFEVAPSSQLMFILDNCDLLPRPSGVGIRYVVQPKPSFGFGEDHYNFENGNFGA